MAEESHYPSDDGSPQEADGFHTQPTDPAAEHLRGLKELLEAIDGSSYVDWSEFEAHIFSYLESLHEESDLRTNLWAIVQHTASPEQQGYLLADISERMMSFPDSHQALGTLGRWTEYLSTRSAGTPEQHHGADQYDASAYGIPHDDFVAGTGSASGNSTDHEIPVDRETSGSHDSSDGREDESTSSPESRRLTPQTGPDTPVGGQEQWAAPSTLSPLAESPPLSEEEFFVTFDERQDAVGAFENASGQSTTPSRTDDEADNAEDIYVSELYDMELKVTVTATAEIKGE